MSRRNNNCFLPCSVRTNIATTFIFYYEGSSTAVIFTRWLIRCIVVFPRHAFVTCWNTAKYTACLTYCCTSPRKSCVTGDSNGLACHVEIVFIGSYLFYCLLLNHSFPTNPNRITNCFTNFSLCLQLYNYIAPASLF